MNKWRISTHTHTNKENARPYEHNLCILLVLGDELKYITNKTKQKIYQKLYLELIKKKNKLYKMNCA